MRQIFSSKRLENVEALAQVLSDAGIQTHISDARSYKGGLRGNFSYVRDEGTKSALWVVHAEDQTRARTILRDAGLLPSTRAGAGGAHDLPAFRSQQADAGGDPRRKRLFRIKMALLAGIVIVLVMTVLRSPAPTTAPAAPQPEAVSMALASPPFDGSVAAALPAVARAVFVRELADVGTPVACLSVDGHDPSTALVAALATPQVVVVPLSQCVRVPDSARGSYHRASAQAATLLDVTAFRPSAADAGTIQFSGYHHRLWGDYKTLQVGVVDGHWQVVKVLKHVAMQG